MVQDVFVNEVKDVGPVTTELLFRCEWAGDYPFQPFKPRGCTFNLDLVLPVADVYVEVILSESELSVDSGGLGRWGGRGFSVLDLQVRELRKRDKSSGVSFR
ncbi:MAG TPA: hypothetical protein VN957_18000 [Chthoniobacterales bacterium]|nr:hypothetical protein [Chthoniobacterales bacterium]